MVSGRIALIFDCDGTIAEDSTTRVLRYLRIDPDNFWAEVRQMEEQGWESTLAYMKLLIDRSQEDGRRRITKRVFQNVGQQLRLSKGIPSFFKEIKQYVARRYESEGISLGIHIISGGIEDVMKASRITSGGFVDDIFGCRFEYRPDRTICFPKTTISYTEKTKYIFAVNKGVSSARLARDPYAVNDYVPEHQRKVPLENMIYIGDGPTDVACMSLLKKVGCEIFAVHTPPRYGIPKTTSELARQGRFTRGPYVRDYRPSSDLRHALEGELDGYAERIIGEVRAKSRPAVRHPVPDHAKARAKRAKRR